MFRFYGGTRETSIERDMADLKWVQKNCGQKGLNKLAKQDKLIGISTIVLVGLVAFGLLALVVWGIQNLVTSGFSWQLLLFNPITFVAVLVGWGITSLNRA